MDYISTKAWKSKIIIQNHSAWFGKDFANRAKRQFRDLGKWQFAFDPIFFSNQQSAEFWTSNYF